MFVDGQKAPHVPWKYFIPMYVVYTGISTQVYGMAIDWLSGSIYWTDALYNWITVARLSAQDIFNHIITTELDRPMGIAVYPQNGYESLQYSITVITGIVIIKDSFIPFPSSPAPYINLQQTVLKSSSKTLSIDYKMSLSIKQNCNYWWRGLLDPLLG